MSWRIPLAVQLIPGILLGFGSLALPQSPRLLIMRGKLEDGRDALRRLRISNRNDTQDQTLKQLIEVFTPLFMLEKALMYVSS